MRSRAPAARCADGRTKPGEPQPLELYVNAVIQRAVENVSEDVRSLRYVSGTRQVRNPDFRAARERFKNAERDYYATESQKKDKEKECANPGHTHDATCVGCTLLGALLGMELGPPDWDLGRRLAAGALGGVLVAFTIVATRMLGAFGEKGCRSSCLSGPFEGAASPLGGSSW